ncbi:MAG TPA: hypothetical protein VF065_07685 [Ilumatobacter sp.]
MQLTVTVMAREYPTVAPIDSGVPANESMKWLAIAVTSAVAAPIRPRRASGG